jgi:predicted transcriptional regulator
MQILWELERAFVKEIVERFPDPKPAYNTVSTITRILQEKGFVDHDEFGKSHRYFPLVGREQYTRKRLKYFLGDYFENSFAKMVSFFSREEEIDIRELEEILRQVKEMKNRPAGEP